MSLDSSSEFNRRAWDAIADSPSCWFRPVTGEQLEAARRGDWQVQVTATRPVPRPWLGDVAGRRVLCLAGGGGHQGPLLAAAGARVTVLDFSERQLSIDARIAAESGLDLTTVAADMRNLEAFADASFDLVINPRSLNFCPIVQPVWNEVRRVLDTGGVLISGFINPVNFLFDPVAMERGTFVVANRIPCRPDGRAIDTGQSGDRAAEIPVEFGHTLDDLIGGQLHAGLAITDLMEDRWGGSDLLSRRIPVFVATRATVRQAETE